MIGAKTPDKFKELSRIFSALDNEIKLSILALLSEEGAKSVTGISKALKINFSTAHKYLEDLESAGLVKSKQETQNRLKRMFSIQDFLIKLSPREISSDENSRSPPKGFKIVTEKGIISNFDEVKFIKPYLEQGLPQSIVRGGINFLKRHVYDGVTLIELRFLFKEYLKNNIDLINKTIATLDKQDIQSRTFSSVLKLMYPKALEQHMNGDIFISNLRYPMLRNCVLDIRGIALHGINKKVASNLSELLNLIIETMDLSRKDTLPNFCLANFNYLIAPLVGNNQRGKIKNDLREFFQKLNERKYNIYLEIDLGKIPNFLKKMPATYILTGSHRSSKDINYTSHQKTAGMLAELTTEVFAELEPRNILPILKSRKWDGITPDITKLSSYYLANVPFNEDNVSYVGRLNRFDSLWSGWFGTNRVGEAQNITINLPRIAMKSTSMNEFIQKLEELIDEAVEYQLAMAELTIADYARNHNVSHPSQQRVKWEYLRIINSIYSLSIIGLNETVFILSGKNLEENPKLGELILKHCSKIIKSKKTNVRIEIKEETNPLIADRFFYLDSQRGMTKVKSYTIGVGCRKWNISAIMQKYLTGGHCTTVPKSKFDIKKALESDVLLFRVN